MVPAPGLLPVHSSFLLTGIYWTRQAPHYTLFRCQLSCLAGQLMVSNSLPPEAAVSISQTGLLMLCASFCSVLAVRLGLLVFLFPS